MARVRVQATKLLQIPVLAVAAACAEGETIIAGAGEPEEGDPMPDYRIRPHWPYGDSLVSVPGYGIRVLPSSGIVQTAVYWAVQGSIRA